MTSVVVHLFMLLHNKVDVYIFKILKIHRATGQIYKG